MDTLSTRYLTTSRNRRNSSSAASASTSPSPRLRHSPLLGGQGNNGNGASDSTDSIATDPSAAHHHRLRKPKSKSRLLSKQRSSTELSSRAAAAAAAAASSHSLDTAPATLSKSKSGSFFGLLRPISSKQRLNASWIPTEPVPHLHTMSTNEASAGVNGSKAPQPRTASSSSPTPPQSALEDGGEAKKDLHGLFPFEGIGSFNVSQWPQTTTTPATDDDGAAMPAAASSSKPAIRLPKVAGRDHSSSLDVPTSDGPQGTLYATAPPSIAGTDTPSGGHDSPAMDGGEKNMASALASRGPSFADEGMTRSAKASGSEEDARSRQASTSGASASVWQASQAQGTAAPALSAGESGAPAPPAALPSATSLKEIRRKAAQRSSVLPALDIPNSNVAAVAGPGPSTSATPARARHVGLAPRSAGGRDMLSDEEDEQDGGRRQGIDGGAEDEDDDDLDLPNAIRARRNNRRMTMMDFLSAEPPASAPALGPTPRSASGPAGALPASASSSSPSSSSLAVPSATTPRRIRQRPQSMIAGSPVRDDESGAPGGRGMSAMEFLATAAPPTTASTLDSPLRSRAVDEDRPLEAITATKGQTREDEERAERRRKRQEQREKEVTLSIEPMVDTVNMFGSTQTSANYSLSGHVLVTVPRPRRAAAGASPPRPITIKSLSLTFAGFSTYVDLSGRYSGIKLCEVPQDLLADGATLPLASDLEAEETATTEPFRYKIQFDLNIPGWLPGSAYSRFGATFYCVGASAVVLNAQGMPSTVSSSERPLLTAEPESLAPTVGEHGELLPNASPTQQMQQLLDVDGDGSSRQRNRGRESWLSKRAKQLSLKTRAASTSTNDGQDQRIASASSFLPPAVRPSISARLDGGGKKWQADGSLLVKSNKYLIVLRRCRDVIPVPVARLAIVGDSLPEGAQDPPPAPVTRQASQQQEDRAQRELPLPAVPEGRASTEAPAAATAAAATSGDDTATAPAPAEPPTPPQPAPPVRAPPAPLPAAPSALNAPTDPSKLAMAARHPPAPVRTSSAIGAGHDGASATMTGDASNSSSNNGTGAPPMRHFLHRPILHPPIDSGIEEGDGLPFSLTISVPSHIQVQNADILTFGIQVEVGRTPAWTKVRDLGGLRLRDMELMCTQSERHTSVPSRTFCATFPVPPEPKVRAIELPVLPAYTPPMGNRAVESSQEVRVRSGYDPEPLRSHLALLDAGKRLAPEENDVERVRSNVVGPPPSFQPKEAGQVEPPMDGKGKGKGKDRRKSAIGLQGAGATGASGSGTSGSGTTRTQAGVTPPLPPPVPPLPSSVDAAPSTAAVESARSDRQQQQREGSTEARSPAPPSNTRGSSPSTTVAIGAGPPVPESATPPTPSLRSTSAAAGAPPTLAVGPSGPRRPSGPPLAMPQVTTASGTVVASTSSSTPSTTSATASTSPTTPRRAGRGRRAYEAAVRGLNSFATAVMDVGYDDGPSGSGSGGAGGFDGNNPSARGGGGGIGGGGDSLDADQPRATYNFSGEDGHGVDLTKGRIRMTVNLPLVSSSASAARREGTPQLLSDYESPHMRVRHKLKVKLGFGFGAKPLGGEGEWGQALVMCVPVRFTEAPPREVREQFAPMPITVANAGDGEGQGQRTIQPPTISLGAAGDAPVLPAYTQLFRDDGSRLNEAEDLPAYPGPRQAASATTTAATAAAVPVPLPGSPAASLRHATAGSTRPALPHRGSVTGPMTPRLNARAPSFVDVSAASSTAGPALMTPGASSSSAAARDVLNDTNGPTGPNSLAPESVVDDALRAITDPDESLAAMREQERELRELAAGGDEDEDDDDDEQEQRPVLGARSATGAALVQMGLGIDEELQGGDDGEGGGGGGGGEAAIGEDTIIMGQEGHEDEDRIRAVEEELGL